MTLPSVMLYGQKVFPIDPPKIQRRLRGLDAVMLRWQTDREDSFVAGSVAPGYPFMRVEDVDTVIEIPGHAYDHRIECKGLIDGKDKIEANRIVTPEEGWDEGQMVTLTVRPDDYEQGQAHPLFSNLLCLDLVKDDVNTYVWRVSGTCRGILNPGSKPKKRTHSVSSEQVQAVAAFSVTDPPGLPPDTTLGPYKWVVFRSRYQLTERYLSDGPPPTHLMGQFLIGDDLPDDVPTIPPSYADLLAGADNRRYNLPWGLVVTAINAPQLQDGRDEHDITIVYTYVQVYEMDGTKQ